MKKLSLLFTALVCASALAFADPIASEYCGEYMSSGNTEAAFTWETTNEGSVVISISETLGGDDDATHFRGNGINIDKIEVGDLREAAADYFDLSCGGSQTITLTLKDGKTISEGTKIYVTDKVVEYATSKDGNAWPTLSFEYTYGGVCVGDPVLTHLILSAPSTFAKIGEGMTLKAVAKDQMNHTMSAEITYEVSPADAGNIKDGVYTPAKQGIATLTAKAGVLSSSIKVYNVPSANLAEGKTVKAGYEPGNAGEVSSKMVDGDISTNWVTYADQDPAVEWAYIDLGEKYTVTGINVVWGDPHSTHYIAQVRLDAPTEAEESDDDAWMTVVDTANITVNSEQFISVNASAQYVRIHSLSKSSNFFRLKEVRVFGTDWIDDSDKEKPVMISAELVSKSSTNAVIAVEATDNNEVAYYRVVDATNGIDKKVVAVEGKITVTGLTASTEYVFTITAIDKGSNESNESKTVSFKTDKQVKIKLTAAASFAQLSESIALQTEALEGYDLEHDGVIRYIITPADGAAVNANAIQATKAGLYSIQAESDNALSEPIELFFYAGENVALGMAVEASGYDTINNLLPQNAVDGNEGSQWSARQGETGTEREYDAWLTVDLGNFYDIEMIAIRWEGACSKQYTVDFSIDNENWRTAYYAGWDKVETHWEYLYGTTEDAKKVRYVRVWSAEAVSQYGIKIMELQVIATEWVPTDDTEKPVLVKAELVSKTDNEAVIAVEATDNYAVKQFRVVEEAHEIDLKMAAEEGMLTLTDLAFGTAYQFAITAVDLVGLESDAQIVAFSTDRLKKLSLTVTPTIGKVGDELALEVEALEEYDLNQDGEIRYTVVPAEAGTVKDGKFVFAMPGNATLVAETDRVFSDSVAVFCYEGKNVAYKIKAEASGYDEEANLLPANAVDGDEATLWSAFNGETDDERIYDAWIVADLGDVYDIEMLAIKWEGACSKKYHVDFSEDNENWRTAYEAGWDKVETHWEYLFGTAVDSKNVRYVRVWSTEAVSQYGIKIWEMKVYAPTDKDPEHPDKPAPAPAPELGEENAVAVFCDVIAGGPQITIGEWGQSTVAELLELEEGDEAYYLSNTNYCGWEFSPAVNASEMNTLHVDLYSTTMSSISLTPISEGPKEGSYTVTLKANEWNSVDIPLSAFAAAGIAWDNIIQFKFMNATPDGSTLYIDNVYFYSDPQSTVEVSIEPSEGRSQKLFRNGQIMIVRGGSVYSILGQTVQ